MQSQDGQTGKIPEKGKSRTGFKADAPCSWPAVFLRQSVDASPDDPTAFLGQSPIPLSSALLETLLELVNASAGINELLLAGEERMALGANVHAQFSVGVALRRAGGHSLATRATNRYLFILRMDSLFHCFSPHSSVAHVL